MNEEFLQRMQSYLGSEYEAYLESLEEELYRGLRINPAKIDEEDFVQSFPYITGKSRFADLCYYVDRPLGLHPYHIAGAFYLQEPSASAVVGLLDVQKDSTVLDLCAAPGSKSTQIYAALENGFLVSNEIDGKRAQALLSNLERMGAVNFALTSMDSHTLCSQLEGCFDRILVDAPCSGEGMMRKHDAARDWSLHKVQACAAIQKDILEDAWLALAGQGILVYSTCTYAREENEAQIANFLKRHPDMELLEIQADFGRPGLEQEGLDAAKVRRIFPMDGGEGQFMAKMRKKSDFQASLPEEAGTKPDKLVSSFLKDQCGQSFSSYSCQKKGNETIWYGMNHPFVHFTKGRVIRQGVRLGSVVKKRFEPDHALYLCSLLAPYWKHRVDLTPQEMDAFMHGDVLVKAGDKGYTALCYKGIPFGFGKSDGKTIKNKIPKGLRLLPNSHVMDDEKNES